MSRCRTSRVAALGALLVASAARAEAPAVALEYAAAAECPGPAEFRDIVTGRLGYDPFRGDGPDHVLVSIVSRGRAFEGRIEWRDPQGKWAGDRTFPSRSEDCRELARAMGFALALQIQFSASRDAPADPAAPSDGTASAEPATVPPTPVVVAPAREQPVVSPPSPAVPSPGPRPRFSLGAGAFAEFGLGVVPGARVFGSLAWPHWSVELASEVSWPATVRREDGAGFSHQELLLSGAGCAAAQPWRACLVGKAGQIRIAGQDVDAPASPFGLALETGLGLGVQQPLGKMVFVAAHVEGLILLTRWRVNLDHNVVWTSPRFAETLGIDVGVSF